MVTLRLERRAEGGCGGLSAGARAVLCCRVHTEAGPMEFGGGACAQPVAVEAGAHRCEETRAGAVVRVERRLCDAGAHARPPAGLARHHTISGSVIDGLMWFGPRACQGEGTCGLSGLSTKFPRRETQTTPCDGRAERRGETVGVSIGPELPYAVSSIGWM